jgi:hypothetical protein
MISSLESLDPAVRALAIFVGEISQRDFVATCDTEQSTIPAIALLIDLRAVHIFIWLLITVVYIVSIVFAMC